MMKVKDWMVYQWFLVLMYCIPARWLFEHESSRFRGRWAQLVYSGAYGHGQYYFEQYERERGKQ